MAAMDGAVLFMISCSLLLFVIGAAHQLQGGIDPSLQPPPGNSLVLKSVTQNGKQVYKCSAKEWVVVGASADLMLASNSSIRVGAYTSNSRRSVPVATWKLDNTAGDEAESGSKFSSVSGKELLSIASGESNISQALLQATSHELDGSATLISYVQLLFPEGGAPPVQAICQLDASMVEVPFQAEFWFWRQDLFPPAVPTSLSVGSERAIQGLFGEGVVVYRYNGTTWQQMQAAATLYTVPGGIVAGKYFFVEAAGTTSLLQGKNSISHDQSYLWQLNAPNYGFQAVGKQLAQWPAISVSVDRHSLPWSLVNISTHSNINNASGTLWEYTQQVQIVSTRGGLPAINTHFHPIKGMTTRAPFSAIFWFYTK